jgi:hypothetical protein
VIMPVGIMFRPLPPHCDDASRGNYPLPAFPATA